MKLNGKRQSRKSVGARTRPTTEYSTDRSELRYHLVEIRKTVKKKSIV